MAPMAPAAGTTGQDAQAGTARLPWRHCRLQGHALWKVPVLFLSFATYEDIFLKVPTITPKEIRVP